MEKILIVEDEKSQRKALRASLEQKGFSILEATNGGEGLGRALSEHPDIILLDVRMPKMDGITMMRKLREDPWGKNASIIILTNYDTTDTQLLQVTAELPSYYLIKANTSLEGIFEKIKKVLDSKKEERKSRERLA